MTRPTSGKQKRALEQIGGALRVSGDPEIAQALRGALRRAETADGQGLTHGFHVYPARMHRGIAAGVLATLGRGQSTLCDPFCGSGTSLVEARLAGVQAYGSDLSPLAIRLAEVKADPPHAVTRAKILEAASAVTEGNHARVRGRVRTRAPLTREQAGLFDGHVLLELAGLWTEIETQTPGRVRSSLEMVFSSMLEKFSRSNSSRSNSSRESASRRSSHSSSHSQSNLNAESRAPRAPARNGATGEEGGGSRVGRFVPTRFFLRKTEELVERWAELEHALPRPSPRPEIWLADALDEDKRGPACDLVLTSPPYGGTYDYQHQHALRCAWLDLDDRQLKAAELGARRHMKDVETARRRWDREVAALLAALAQRCKPEGRIVILIGDGDVGRSRVPADTQVTRLATRANLAVEAIASQRRRDWQGGADREEHLISLRWR